MKVGQSLGAVFFYAFDQKILNLFLHLSGKWCILYVNDFKGGHLW